MRLYIAGPMRGRPGRNYQAFDAAAALIRAMEHTAINPADRARERYNIVSDDDLDEATLQSALADDFRDLLACDGVVLLEGWEDSEGARAEELIARLTGKLRFKLTREPLTLEDVE